MKRKYRVQCEQNLETNCKAEIQLEKSVWFDKSECSNVLSMSSREENLHNSCQLGHVMFPDDSSKFQRDEKLIPPNLFLFE